MKTFSLFLLAILMLIMTGIFTGCKKSNDKKTSCKISTITPVPTGTALQLSYNSEGRLSRVVSGTSVLTYEYTDNTTIVTALNADTLNSKTIVNLNPAGLAINVRVETDASGANWNNTFYEYNEDELAKSTFTISTGGRPVISTYGWSNHNMVSSTTDTTTTNYGYYTDKPRQSGDYLDLVQQLQGYEIYRTKNLVKSISSAVITYEFGSDGKINSLQATTGTTSSFLDYQYQCN
ncbi:MAG: hypothetical protein Q8941_24760 [Bacteroidota bacterium]|nr:hypothetical protein [Bacteroidota bacterium]